MHGNRETGNHVLVTLLFPLTHGIVVIILVRQGLRLLAAIYKYFVGNEPISPSLSPVSSSTARTRLVDQIILFVAVCVFQSET